MARSKRSSKKIMKGGELSWDLRKWFSSEQKTDTVVTTSPTTPTTPTSIDTNSPPTNSTPTNSTPTNEPQQQEPATTMKKPWYQFWGGKTKRSKSKGRKTKKTRK